MTADLLVALWCSLPYATGAIMVLLLGGGR